MVCSTTKAWNFSSKSSSPACIRTLPCLISIIDSILCSLSALLRPVLSKIIFVFPPLWNFSSYFCASWLNAVIKSETSASTSSPCLTAESRITDETVAAIKNCANSRCMVRWNVRAIMEKGKVEKKWKIENRKMGFRMMDLEKREGIRLESDLMQKWRIVNSREIWSTDKLEVEWSSRTMAHQSFNIISLYYSQYIQTCRHVRHVQP